MNTIVKDIYYKTPKFDDVRELHSYLSDKVKTETDKNISGLGFIKDDYMNEFLATNVANQHTHTNQTRQITISISPPDNTCSDDEYIQIGREFGEYYYEKGYQVIVYLHKDTTRRHLHLLINAVNFKTGKVFKQSLKGLNRFKVHCSNILRDHKLDIIGMSTEKMLDTTPHDINDGFDACEIYDEVMADNATIFQDLYEDKEPTSDVDYSTNNFSDLSTLSWPVFTGYNAYTYKKPIIPEPTKALQEENTMEYSVENKEVPALNLSHLPSEVPDKTCLFIDSSKNVNLTVPSNYDVDQLKDIINSVEPIPEKDRATNAKIGLATSVEYQNRGIDIPVYVDTSTNINIKFDDVMSSNIFDTTFTEK